MNNALADPLLGGSKFTTNDVANLAIGSAGRSRLSSRFKVFNDVGGPTRTTWRTEGAEAVPA